MKHSPRLYARALAETADRKLEAAEEKTLIENFLNAVRRNGDVSALPKIINEAENLILERAGRRKVVVESARALSPETRNILGRLLEKEDVLEMKIDPELVAGIKISVNQDLQFDGSLKRKMEKLFQASKS